MKLRADHVIMGVVVGLGIFALVRMGSAKPTPTPAPPEKGEAPGLPTIPNDVRSGPLRVGTRYLGRLDLAGSPSREAVRELLKGVGFVEIMIYETPGAAAEEVPPLPFVLDAPGAGTRWFRAMAGKTGRIARPSWMTYLWATTT